MREVRDVYLFRLAKLTDLEVHHLITPGLWEEGETSTADNNM